MAPCGNPAFTRGQGNPTRRFGLHGLFPTKGEPPATFPVAGGSEIRSTGIALAPCLSAAEAVPLRRGMPQVRAARRSIAFCVEVPKSPSIGPL